MAEQTPDTAIDAILETDKQMNNYTVYPITIARYALLELVKSPFITSGSTFTVLNIIPSLYIMLHDVKELKGYNSSNIMTLEEKAVEWSETIDINSMGNIVEDIQKKVMSLYKVAPETGGEDGNVKKKEA